MNKSNFACGLAIAVAFAACAGGGGTYHTSDYQRAWPLAIGDGQIVPGLRVGRLQLGMSRVDLHDLLGEPSSIFELPNVGGPHRYERFYYPGIAAFFTDGMMTGEAVGTAAPPMDTAPAGIDVTQIPRFTLSGHPLQLGVTTRAEIQSWLGRPLCYQSAKDGFATGLVYAGITFRLFRGDRDTITGLSVRRLGDSDFCNS